MNLSTSHTPIQSMLAPRKEGSSADTNLNVQVTVETSLQPISEPTTPANNRPVNPTYDKPSSNTTLTPEIANEADPLGDGIAQKSIANEVSDTEQDAIVKDKSSNPENNNQTYSEAEIELISSLKLRDAEVGAHERAHSTVGGQHAGSPSYSYKSGPDGVKYAVTGEVSIDTSPVAGNPQATLQKAQQIKAAALAPADPSGQDKKVAAKADHMATQARNEILETNRGEETKKNRSRTGYEGSVPDSFTGQQSLSIDKNMDNTTEMQMQNRNFHINKLYQSNASTITPSKFEAQA
jgi:hypothetical protein